MMFTNASEIYSISEIASSYPDEWVAIAVEETDADGFAAAGEIITHNQDESFVWSAVKLRDSAELVYIFFTGSRQQVRRAA